MLGSGGCNQGPLLASLMMRALSEKYAELPPPCGPGGGPAAALLHHDSASVMVTAPEVSVDAFGSAGETQYHDFPEVSEAGH